ncbi:hypothetical protein SELMODRAFT_421827 [Selaginella moellendorffii]|uniref:Uncharacterized protein n=1 Tax=Selaginella moellendorffii TaxID=88036 RepID=D8SGH4_SELML|nr:hypothetical protein SELMODRAFT_421827 [Selaginella moellendorffii]
MGWPLYNTLMSSQSNIRKQSESHVYSELSNVTDAIVYSCLTHKAPRSSLRSSSLPHWPARSSEEPGKLRWKLSEVPRERSSLWRFQELFCRRRSSLNKLPVLAKRAAVIIMETLASILAPGSAHSQDVPDVLLRIIQKPVVTHISSRDYFKCYQVQTSMNWYGISSMRECQSFASMKLMGRRLSSNLEGHY